MECWCNGHRMKLASHGDVVDYITAQSCPLISFSSDHHMSTSCKLAAFSPLTLRLTSRTETAAAQHADRYTGPTASLLASLAHLQHVQRARGRPPAAQRGPTPSSLVRLVALRLTVRAPPFTGRSRSHTMCLSAGPTTQAAAFDAAILDRQILSTTIQSSRTMKGARAT